MCFEKRKTPARCIAVLSGLAAIMGILMIVFSFMLTNSDLLDQMGKEDADIKSGVDSTFTMLLIFSLATIAIAVIGFFLLCCKNRCITCTYGIILLPTWIILIVVGFLATAIATAADDAITKECNTLTTYSTGTTYNNQDITISLDIYDSIRINDYMCKPEYCACEATSKATDWISDGTRTASDFASTGTTYTSYSACVRDADNRGGAASGDSQAVGEFKEFTKSFLDQSDFEVIFEWIEFFENEYDCAGICTPSVWYWGRSIAEGRPSKSCITSIKDDVTGAFTGLGIVTLVSGILMLFIFIMQYCLWKKYD